MTTLEDISSVLGDKLDGIYEGSISTRQYLAYNV